MFNAKGLSYPAVSDWVVPVASANDAGTVMSGFSQRDDHVLVAPGESITSTVPDELFSFDGTPNDWASASGTSMASPYVAGVSVLVREAYAFMGEANVDQGMIYDSLFDTANLIFDPITGGNYHFIDVEAALDSIITDSLADDSATATNMGMMGDGYQFSEVIGKMTDQDYFSFIAESSGTMSFTVTGMTAHWDLSGGGGSVNGNTLTFDVVAGQTYTLGVMNGGGMSHYDVAVQLEEGVVDWGTVERNEFNGVSVSGEQWYTITATRTGLATIEASNVGGAPVTLEFYTGDGSQLIDSDVSSTGYNRVDANVTAGETLLVRVVGDCDIDFNAWNIVGVSGNDYEVLGTTGDDAFTFVAGNTHEFSVNGLSYQVADAQLERIEFQGGEGADAIVAVGGAGDDTATTRSNYSELQGASYQVLAYVENVQIDGGGGWDTAKLFDSQWDDTLVATPEEVTLAGGDLSHTLTGFDKVKVYATEGGFDTATFFDSEGDDELRSKPNWTRLSGDGFYNYAKGFERVEVYAAAGGDDTAIMYDSEGDDDLLSKPNWTRLSGDGFYNYASGFDSVKVYAESGGFDTATMHDSEGNDDLRSKHHWTRLMGDDFYIYAKGFDEVRAYADSGGYDVAEMYDSAGDDDLRAKPNWTRLSGNGFYNYVNGFDRVEAFASLGGDDRARLYDSEFDDELRMKPNWTRISGPGYYNYVNGFDVVQVYAESGGYDRGHLYDSAGNDLLNASADRTRMEGDGFLNYVSGFDRIRVYAEKGGYDTALLESAHSGDVLQIGGSKATLEREESLQIISGFDAVTAESAAGETPTLELEAVDYAFETEGDWM